MTFLDRIIMLYKGALTGIVASREVTMDQAGLTMSGQQLDEAA